MQSLRDSLVYTPVELDFGTSGLRGKITDMTDLECYINTAGFITYLLESGNIEAGATVSLAGDLRSSTPRIMQAIVQAISDAQLGVEFLGFVPTPAIAYWALTKGQACIMVTGSHIPDDRNGIKFYKRGGEVLKSDEQGIKAAVAKVRSQLYDYALVDSGFDKHGALCDLPALSEPNPAAQEAYIARYTNCLSNDTLHGKKVIVYQHSAVGRDLLVELFTRLGAEVIAVDRSEKFIPIDTENVTPDNQAYFRSVAAAHPDAFAIISTDGDSDRPFLVDETGQFHRGDVLGILVSAFLQADFAAVPVSANDAVNQYLGEQGIELAQTRIGSPYVIVAMQAAQEQGARCIVGWEVNGGFLLGTDVPFGSGTLKTLPTRDAVLPLLAPMLLALRRERKLSELFAELPRRYTSAGLIDNFPVETSRTAVEKFSQDTRQTRQALARFFTPEQGFDDIEQINTTDGVRISFKNGDIVHIRPSGNAPQLRVYSVAASQERADAIVALGISEPNGILRQLEASIS